MHSKEKLPSWTGYIQCPNCCNANLATDNELCPEGICSHCQCAWQYKDNVVTWKSLTPHTNKAPSRQALLKKIRNQLNPLSSWLLPFRYITHYRSEQYYQRTLTDRALAERWSNHYLKGLDLAPGALVLDYGCGRGRHTALANLCGFQTLGQDIYQHRWWQKITASRFQTLAPHFDHLPWRDQTFSAVFCFGVLHYLDQKSLGTLAEEFFRILKPGGYIILLEANDKNYGAFANLKQLGRLHSAELVRQVYKKLGFNERSFSYEGFYAPIFPLFINYLRKQLSFKTFDLSDFSGYLESKIKPERRALWLMKLQKPETAA